MTEPTVRFEPQPPAPRAATTLAAALVLVLVFAVGIAVGQSGALGSGASSRPSAPASGTPQPGASGSPSSSGQPQLPAGAPADFDLFWQALQTVRDSFVGRDDVTDRQLTYGAIRGMVEALGDTGHSIFLTAEAVQAQNESLGGSVVGIGVLLGERDGQVVIISVISGGPADRAGIRPGDRIVSVDGTSVDGLAPEEVAPKVRGDEGSTVALTIVRQATGEQVDLSIVREELHFPAATWAMVPGTKIGLLRLIQFSTGSAAELRQARDDAVAAGATSFIMDLRSNPGGYVGEAVDVASLFLDQKTVYIRELVNDDRIPVLSNDGIPATDAPLVVLIDAGTASSAEIVSGALRSANRGELVGQTTFGTGTVLLDFPLADGSAIRLAVERWLTPDGELIFGRGIEPTVDLAEPVDQVPLGPGEVGALDSAEVPNINDDQLKRAIELLSQ